MHFAGIYDVLKKGRELYWETVWKIVALLNSFFIIGLDNLSIAKFWCCKNFLLSYSFTSSIMNPILQAYADSYFMEVKVWRPSLPGYVNITFLRFPCWKGLPTLWR